MAATTVTPALTKDGTDIIRQVTSEANFSKSQLRKPPDERAPDPNNAQQHAI